MNIFSCSPLSSDPDIENVKIMVGPNPVHEKLSISGDFQFIEIYDTHTKLIYSGNDWEIDLFGVPAGMYLIKVFNEGKVYMRKLIVI